MEDRFTNIEEDLKRCINCKNASCAKACPLGVDIPRMIELAKNGDYDEAFNVEFNKNPFGLICGIVCPHEKQCEGACVLGIKGIPNTIGNIESYICQKEILEGKTIINLEKSNEPKVAIVGGGPSGIALAHFLSRDGIASTIFEKENYLGGILEYGIPDFRLDKSLVKKNIEYLLNDYINVEYGKELVGTSQKENKNQITIDDLKDMGYEYIYLGIGLGKSKSLPIEGVEEEGVVLANDYLKGYSEGKLSSNDERVIIIGGGNVAIDSARTANKLSGKATIVYRKVKDRMPANKKEIEEAEQEGVKFVFESNLTNIKRVNNELVTRVNDEYEIVCDKIILAIGSGLDKNSLDEKIELDENGFVKVNENYETSIKNVFAGGDIVYGNSTVASAIKTAKDVSIAIIKNINELHK